MSWGAGEANPIIYISGGKFDVHIPVNEDAGLGEHQKPQVHEALFFKHHGEGVVDQHSTVGQPQSGKNHHYNDQHLHHLQQKQHCLQLPLVSFLSITVKLIATSLKHL